MMNQGLSSVKQTIQKGFLTRGTTSGQTSSQASNKQTATSHILSPLSKFLAPRRSEMQI